MRAVNLLPADRRKNEKKAAGAGFKPMHGAVAGIVLGAVALGYWGHSIGGKVAQETSKEEAALQEQETLKAKIAKAKEATGTPVVSTYESNRDLIAGLASSRVNWSPVMVNLARVAPKGVWLKTLNVEAPTSESASATATPGTARPAAIKLTAAALSRTDAALYLARLNAIPGFVDARFALSGGGASGGSDKEPGINFSIEIPVDETIFGPGAGPASTSPAPAASSTPTPSQP